MSVEGLAPQQWDKVYREGKYQGDPSIAFVDDILHKLSKEQLFQGRGLYVGCGNGRNYVPLLNAGLDLIGLDFSEEALSQLSARSPKAADKLILGEFSEYYPEEPLDYVVSIQIFQHGNNVEVAEHFRRTAAMLKPGGLLFLRVNSTATEIFHPHDIVEQTPEGGFTVLYTGGPKIGRNIHFYTKEELLRLTETDFEVVLPPSQAIEQRKKAEEGTWAQWEAILRRKLAV